MPDEFDYRASPLTKVGQVRVLVVSPGARRDPIVCRLEPLSLSTEAASMSPHNQRISYEALSYYWGDAEPNSPIELHAGDSFGIAMIRPNLHAALDQLRLLDRPRTMWIDAICINQADYEEQNSQVALMTQIYTKATHISVWLGEASTDSNLALDFITRILNLEDFERLMLDQRTPQEWAALASLMKRQWFGRRWVVQEIALARRATLYCGDAHVTWSDFSDAISLFEAVEAESHNSLMDTTTFKPIPDFFGDVKYLAASRLVNATNKLFRRAEDGVVLERFLPLDTILLDLTEFQTSRPHDIIYSALGIAKGIRALPKRPDETSRSIGNEAKAESPENFQGKYEIKLVKLATRRFTEIIERGRFYMNYSKPFLDVCKDFLKFVIKDSGSLDLLCRPWLPLGAIATHERPSWLLTTSNASYGLRPDGRYSRKNADTLVGMPGSSSRNYNASRSLSVESERDLWIEGKPNSLFVKGFVVDTVARKLPYAVDGIILNEWLAAGGWSNLSGMPPDSFWRTLVANKGPDGSNPPTFYPRALKTAVNQSVDGGHISTNTLMQNTKSTFLFKFLQRVQETIWMRRLIVTEYGLLGLAPEKTKKRDLICILHGCSVPVVLRPTSDGGMGDEYFEFVGECYVHGIMEGEAFALARSRSETNILLARVFEIR